MMKSDFSLRLLLVPFRLALAEGQARVFFILATNVHEWNVKINYSEVGQATSCNES